VLYAAALGAALGGTFSLPATSGRIMVNVAGEIAIGLAALPAARRLRHGRLRNGSWRIVWVPIVAYLSR
jgi:hypothetical protein